MRFRSMSTMTRGGYLFLRKLAASRCRSEFKKLGWRKETLSRRRRAGSFFLRTHPSHSEILFRWDGCPLCPNLGQSHADSLLVSTRIPLA